MTKHLTFACLALVTSMGCGGTETTVVQSPSDGTLTLDWTINGTHDPAQCNQGAVATIDITVDTIDGASAGEFQQDCGAFATTITLPPGSYTASAVLLDASGADR